MCYFSGIGKSSKEGILIKGSDYLDGIKDIKEIVFDKTGTLTKGQFTIDKVEVYDQLTKRASLRVCGTWGKLFKPSNSKINN